MNLIKDQWIPVRFKDGTEGYASPHEILGSDTSVEELNAPRPDFNGSLIQFMIGLAQTTMMPGDDDAWEDILENMPSCADVKCSFDTVAHAFYLDGDDPRFMQDNSSSEEKTNSIDSLLIEMPGENTIRKNADFFQKRNAVTRICPGCAAMALMSLQMNGPAGGAGHRTGLRGGGPITSIIEGKNLNETIWLNVLPKNRFSSGFSHEEKNGDADIFPWMGPLRTSEKGQPPTSILDANRLQIFWGTGRRIWLDFSDTSAGACDLCGCDSERLISGYSTKTYGVSYDSTWRHTLSPYYQNEEEWLPLHCQPGGMSYRNWLGLVINDNDGKREVAAVVGRFYSEHKRMRRQDVSFKLWSFGYDLDNMKARCWYESRMPLVVVDDSYRSEYETHISQVVKTARNVQDSLNQCVKEAWNGSHKKGGEIRDINQRFWTETEPLFYNVQGEILDSIENDGDTSAVKLNWLNKLNKHSIEKLFDFYSQSQYVDKFDPKQIVSARKKLIKFTHPRSKKISGSLGLSEIKGNEA